MMGISCILRVCRSVRSGGRCRRLLVTLRDGLFAGQFPGGDPLGHTARAEVGLRRQGQFGVHHDIAWLHRIVCVLVQADLPAAFRRAYLGQIAPGDFQPLAEGCAVERFELGVERAAGFFNDAGNDAAEAVEIVRIEIDLVDRWRQGGVVQRFETFTHVAHDFENDIARRGRRPGRAFHRC